MKRNPVTFPKTKQHFQNKTISKFINQFLHLLVFSVTGGELCVCIWLPKVMWLWLRFAFVGCSLFRFPTYRDKSCGKGSVFSRHLMVPSLLDNLLCMFQVFVWFPGVIF